MTLPVSPAVSLPTVITPMPFVRSMLRETICCSATTVCEAASVASEPVQGMAPCACEPLMLISNASALFKAAPCETSIFPEGARAIT